MLVENQEFEHGEAFAASVDLVLADLPYIIARVSDYAHSKHYNIASADRKAMLMLLQRDATDWSVRTDVWQWVAGWNML